MATGIFIHGFTVTEVLGIQSAAKAALAQGLTVVSYTDSGTSVSKSWPIPPMQILEECAYALRVLEPETYAAPVARVRRHNYTGTISI